MRKAVAVILLLLLVVPSVLATGETGEQDDVDKNEVWAVWYVLVMLMQELSVLLHTIQYETNVDMSIKLQIKETLEIIKELLVLLKR